MVGVNIASYLVYDAEAEAKWDIEDQLRSADRAFRKARRAALGRRLRKYLGQEGRVAAFDYPRVQRFDVAIRDISGIVDDKGSLVEGIPALPKTLLKAWRSAYAVFCRGDEGDEGQSRFGFRLVGGSTYLEGGTRALLRLELARSRGELHVRGIASGAASPVPVPVATASPVPLDAQPEAPSCEGLACGIAS